LRISGFILRLWWNYVGVSLEWDVAYMQRSGSIVVASLVLRVHESMTGLSVWLPSDY
jgi:hypothetical protein